MRYAAPSYRTVPTKAYASISDDVPPQIWEVVFYKDKREMKWLRCIPVMVMPDIRKSKKRKRK